jgi:hypothetical protein
VLFPYKRRCEYTLDAYKDSLPILKKAVDEGDIRKYLRGEPVEPVFRKLVILT